MKPSPDRISRPHALRGLTYPSVSVPYDAHERYNLNILPAHTVLAQHLRWPRVSGVTGFPVV